jgi:restriction endonuclease S subunit
METINPKTKSIFSRLVNQAKRNAVEVPLTPSPEPKQNAHNLPTAPRGIVTQDRISQTTTELKRALIQTRCTESRRPEPQKQTEIGPAPESWELVKLGELFETQLGKMLSQKARTGSDPKPYLRNKNVQWREIATTDLLLMAFDRRGEAKFSLLPRDLLICEGGQPGRVAIWRGQMQQCHDQHIDKLPEASTIAHLPEVQLKTLPIPMTSRSEQDAIVERLNTADQKITSYHRKHANLTALFLTS